MCIEETEDCDFLFKYFDIDPASKTLPKPIQYMISGDLVDLVAGCFTLEKPYRELELNHKITAFTFNNKSGTCLAFNNKDKLVLYDTETEQTVESQPFSGGIGTIAISPDNTKITVLGVDTFCELVKTEDNGFVPYDISSIDKLFNYTVVTLGYTSDNRLMVTATTADIGILDESYETLDEYYVNPKPLSEKPTLAPNMPWRSERRIWDTVIQPQSHTAAFTLSPWEIIVFSDGLHQEHAVPRNQELRSIKVALSPDGNLVAFITREKNTKKEFVYIWEILTREYIKVYTLNQVSTTVRFSPNSKFLLIKGMKYWHLYDIEYDRLVAQYNFELPHVYLEAFSTFNTRGTLFAVAVLDHPITTYLNIWQFNPLWNNLQELYTGKLTIEQVLFILFIRDLSQKRLSFEQALPTLVKKHKISSDRIKKSLQRTFSTFSDSLKTYCYYILAPQSQDINTPEEENQIKF